MTVTITLKGVLLTIIAVLAIVVLIYIIMLLRKLISTLKQVDDILTDTQKMTAIASDRVQQVDGVMDDLGDTVTVMVDAVKGNQSIVAALTHIVDAASSFVGLVRKGKDDEKGGEGEEKTAEKSRERKKQKHKKKA